MPLGTEQNKVLEHCLQVPMGQQGPQLMGGLPSGTVQRGCPSDDGKVTACSSLRSLLGLQDQALLLKGDPPSSSLPLALELDSRDPSQKVNHRCRGPNSSPRLLSQT